MNIAKLFILLLLLPLFAQAQNKHELSISGTSFYLNGKLFPYNGISFFNAIYNPAFNKSSQERIGWLQKFQRYGIQVIRVWAQWDNKRGFVDAAATATLYASDGQLHPQHLSRLKDIIQDADGLGMAVELALFARESWNENIRLSDQASEKAVAALSRELLPYRNVVFQIWNEFDYHTIDYYKIIKSIDAKRLVTNSPGYGGDLGSRQENKALDFLTPHTSRQSVSRHWEVAPQEIAYLLKLYNKPVVDDEPARNGTPEFGGPSQGSSPYDHIIQIYQVWQAGGYIVYHHDMFQKGYGHASVPAHGIPDPEFSPYHKQVLEFIARYKQYQAKYD
jgi:hypothetical protein